MQIPIPENKGMVPYNTTVFIPEVVAGFQASLKEHAKVSSGEPIPVKWRDFDPENPSAEINTYPTITITHLYSDFDVFRFHPDHIRVSLDTEKFQAEYEPPAQPWSLYMQVDFWADNARQKYDMQRSWMANFYRPDYFNLPVFDMSGAARSCAAHQVDHQELAETKNGKRIFHSAYTYRIWVEINEGVRYTMNVLEKVDLSVHPGGV